MIPKEELPLCITLSSLAEIMNMTEEQAQKFADISIERGIIIAIGEGIFECVSPKVINRIRELIEIQQKKGKS